MWIMKKMYQGRFPLLRKAYHNSHIAENAEFIAFCEENDWWLSDYALFMAIKDSQGGSKLPGMGRTFKAAGA